MVRVAAFQTASHGILTKPGRVSHVERLTDLLREQLTGKPVDLVVLPELCTIEYSQDAFRNLGELAEGLDGESTEKMAALAKQLGCYVAYGFPRRDADEFRISHVVLDRQGAYVTHYDKLHMAQFGASRETPFFSRGEKLGVFSLDGIRIGIMICYDFRFPEYARLLTKEYDVDLILHPVAFTRDETFASWHPFVITRAFENQVYLLSINRSGRDWGKSIFCPPWIDDSTKPTVMGTEEELHVFDVRREDVERSREMYPLLRDRLDSYDDLMP